MTRYAFSLGLSPVQEWIAEASRSRDLRAGSAFLSWLMAKVLVALEAELEVDVEIPRSSKAGGYSALAGGDFAAAMRADYGIPNRASGFCSDRERTVPEVFGALRDEVVVPAWEAWKDEYLRGGQVVAASRELWQAVDRHRVAYEELVGHGGDCPFQVAWVIAPAEAEGSVEGHLKTIDRLYSEVKRSRPVEPWQGGSEVPKCTVCGKRESAGPTESMKAWRDWHAENDRLGWVQRGWRIDPGERLCYVCLAKRMAAYADRSGEFPSTGMVAAAPWLEEIRRTDGAPAAALKRLEAAVADGDERGDLGRALFSSDGELEKRGLDKVVTALGALREALVEYEPPPPTKGEPALPRIPTAPPSYLALVAFDGDDMGRHLQADPAGVSERIDAFARKARARLAEPREPAIFYLGGDEGLALLPAHEALGTVTVLREKFSEEMGAGLTLSAGLVFFEQRRPMGGALGEARRLLSRAKSVERKDALAVAVQTASGTRWELVDRWGATWERVARAVRAVREGELSSGWAYDVESFLESMDEATWQSVARSPERVRLEVERLLWRRMPRRAGETREDHRERAAKLWLELRGEALWEPHGNAPAPRGSEMFHLVGFLVRQLGVKAPADERDAAERPGEGAAA